MGGGPGVQTRNSLSLTKVSIGASGCGEGSEIEQYAGSYAPIVKVGGGWEVWCEGSLSWKFAAWIRLVACAMLSARLCKSLGRGKEGGGGVEEAGEGARTPPPSSCFTINL